MDRIDLSGLNRPYGPDCTEWTEQDRIDQSRRNGHSWSTTVLVGPFGLVRSNLIIMGPLWSYSVHLVLLYFIQSHLVQYVQFTPFGLVQSTSVHLVLFNPHWYIVSYLVLFSPLWSYLVLFVQFGPL